LDDADFHQDEAHAQGGKIERRGHGQTANAQILHRRCTM
jgi:hypothetical protein